MALLNPVKVPSPQNQGRIWRCWHPWIVSRPLTFSHPRPPTHGLCPSLPVEVKRSSESGDWRPGDGRRSLCAAALPQFSEAKLFPGVLRPSRSLTRTHRVALEAAGVEKSSPPAILLQIVTSRVKHCNKLVHRRDCGQRNTFTAMPTPTAVTGFQYGRRIFKRQNIRNFWSFMIYRKQVQ